jgi:hypothetical protein
VPAVNDPSCGLTCCHLGVSRTREPFAQGRSFLFTLSVVTTVRGQEQGAMQDDKICRAFPFFHGSSSSQYPWQQYHVVTTSFGRSVRRRSGVQCRRRRRRSGTTLARRLPLKLDPKNIVSLFIYTREQAIIALGVCSAKNILEKTSTSKKEKIVVSHRG